MTDPTPSFEELRAAVESELRQLLEARRRALPEAGEMVAEIARLIDAGGKRLRPAFCYWGHRAAGGGHSDEIVRAAASLELLHTFALVHDDVMDAAEERRGRPTVHAVHGAGVAILTGDLALVLADDLFFSAGFSHSVSLAGFDAYSRMRQQVIAGQFLDLSFENDPFVTEERARRMAVLKSGRYSIEEPLRIGALLAGSSPRAVESIGAFGAPLGEAFQLRDDLLGVFGDPHVTGKSADADIRAGKRNVLYAKTIAMLAEPERTELIELWGKGAALDEGGVQRARELIEGCGARVATERLLEDLVAQAGTRLEGLDAPPEARAALGELAEFATNRSA